MAEPLQLDVWSDVACPWCWVGHARLQRALAEEEPGAVVVRHRAYELQPHAPPEGRAFDPPDAASDHLTAEAAKEGLEFRGAGRRTLRNTRLAHRLLKVAEHAGGPDAGMAALHALFAAHFAEDRDVSDPASAVEIVARAAGFDATALRAAADEGAGEPEVAADQQLAARIGVQGVPFFLAGGRVAISGAHEPALLRKLVKTARERAAAA